MNEATAMAFEGFAAGYWPGRWAVEAVSGAWRAGSLTVLLGPNGSGKSTLLKGALGLLGDTSGAVRCGGDDPRRMRAGVRARRLAYVPQQGAVRFGFGVREVVAMGRHASVAGPAADAAAVDLAMERFDLLAFKDRVYTELSGGQQRRVLLARGFAQVFGAGEVLLADEPTDGLDLKHAEDAMAALRGLAHGALEQASDASGVGVAVVAVLHDLNLAARYADEVWLLDGGRVTFAGATAEALEPSRLEAVYGLGLERVSTADGMVLVPRRAGRGEGVGGGGFAGDAG